MKKNEVKVGGKYYAKVGAAMTTVRVDDIKESYTPTGAMTRYFVTNLRTGRKTVFRSAAKFRSEVKPLQMTPTPNEDERAEDEQSADPTDQVEQMTTSTVSGGEPTASSGKVIKLGKTWDESEGKQCSDPTSAPSVVDSQVTATASKSPEVEDEKTRDPFADPNFKWPQSGFMEDVLPETERDIPTRSTGIPDNASVMTAERSAEITQSKSSLPRSGLLTPQLSEMAHSAVLSNRRIAGYIPTDEQGPIIDVAQTLGAGDQLIISAGAGAGKTSTLRMLEEVLHGRGQYTAFNKSLVDESRLKFKKARCSTTHSLAFNVTGKMFSSRLNGGRIKSDEVARILGIQEQEIQTPWTDRGVKRLSAAFLAGQVIMAVKKFCQSADGEVKKEHFKYIDGIDESIGGKRQYKNNDMMKGYLLDFARKAWDDLSQPTGRLPFHHDIYVKTWQLGEGAQAPFISAEYILLDEAQDTAPVLLDILRRQRHALLVFVGDSNQQIYCQPQGTIVTVVKKGSHRQVDTPIERLRIGDRVLSYHDGYRLGRITRDGCRVSAISSRLVDEELIQVNCLDYQSRYTKSHHCMVMLGEMLKGQCAVYMQRSGDFYRVGSCQGVYDSQSGQIGPIVRARQECADALWILASFSSREEAYDHEQSLLKRFHGRCFESSGGSDWWEFQVPNRDAANALLLEHDKDISEPLITIGDKWVDRMRTPVVTAARNLISGMMMLPAKNVPYDEKHRGCLVKKDHWLPISVSSTPYKGRVVSISIEGDHNYVADGLLTHNSWRGAVDAMKAFPDAPRKLLTQSFRFGQIVADVANSILAGLSEPTDLIMRGLPSIPSITDKIDRPRCVLCRTNARAVATLLQCVTEGKKPCLIGGGSDVIAFVKGARDLKAGRATSHPDLACFSSWHEVEMYSKEDEGEDLRLMVKLIKEFGCEGIIAALESQPEEKYADVVVSTAHKSKGREWDTVKLAEDFPPATKMTDSDRRLLYVAATRAKLGLDISVCPPFMNYVDEDSQESSPGIDVKYTIEMPSKEDYGRALSEMRSPKSAPAPVVDSVQAQQDRSRLQNADVGSDGSIKPLPTGFTWAKHDGDWVVKGAAGNANRRVQVTRRNGSTSVENLGAVVSAPDEFTCLYAIARR